VAERIRVALEAARVSHGAETINVTASLGVAAGGPDAMACADQALYESKRAGRNTTRQAHAAVH
jgi:PleD family two-component response regulator